MTELDEAKDTTCYYCRRTLYADSGLKSPRAHVQCVQERLQALEVYSSTVHMFLDALRLTKPDHQSTVDYIKTAIIHGEAFKCEQCKTVRFSRDKKDLAKIKCDECGSIYTFKFNFTKIK